MYNSKLVQVFLKLSGTEKRAINKFVESPFHNHREEVIVLWRYMVSHVEEGRPAFEKVKVYESVYPGQDYDDKLLRHLCSWLLQCIEEYLALSVYRSTPALETLHRAKAYRDKKLEKHFQKVIRTGKKQLEHIPRGIDFFHFNHQFAFENFRFVEKRKLINESYLMQMTSTLDKYILMSKLKQACIVQAHQSVFTTQYDFSLIDLLLEFLKSSEYLNEPGIACYYCSYRALTENNEVYFHALKDNLRKYQVVLPIEDVEYLYYSAINFCIRNLNKGISKYRRETFELYRTVLEQGYLTKEGKLSRFAYNNIVSTGLSLGEFDWLENFIYEYKSMIDPRYRESNFTYNLAKLNFAQKNYDEAMKLLVQIDERDLLLNLDAKAMLIRIYYELDEYDALTSLLSSFNVMLGRKKVLSYHKKHYKNIIRFTKRMLYLKPGDKKAYEKLKMDIEQAEVLGLKDWFLAQLG